MPSFACMVDHRAYLGVIFRTRHRPRVVRSSPRQWLTSSAPRAPSSTQCAIWAIRAPLGAICPATSPHGRWSISRRVAGSWQTAVKRFAVDTLGHVRALVVTPARDDERSHVEALAAQEQPVTDERVEIACVDSGHTGPEPAANAAEPGIELVVVKTSRSQVGRRAPPASL